MALLSHLRAMLTDPGAVPKDAAPLLDDEDQEAGELDMDTGSFNSSHRRRKQVHLKIYSTIQGLKKYNTV